MTMMREPSMIMLIVLSAALATPAPVWNFVKISPEEAWCFDSRVFGEERREIDLKNLNLKLGY
jgi:hypothetical protein